MYTNARQFGCPKYQAVALTGCFVLSSSPLSENAECSHKFRAITEEREASIGPRHIFEILDNVNENLFQLFLQNVLFNSMEQQNPS
jgi:hypothetical protein